MCGNGMTEGRNNGTMEGQGESSIAPTFSKRGYKYGKMGPFIYFDLKKVTYSYIHISGEAEKGGYSGGTSTSSHPPPPPPPPPHTHTHTAQDIMTFFYDIMIFCIL